MLRLCFDFFKIHFASKKKNMRRCSRNERFLWEPHSVSIISAQKRTISLGFVLDGVWRCPGMAKVWEPTETLRPDTGKAIGFLFFMLWSIVGRISRSAIGWSMFRIHFEASSWWISVWELTKTPDGIGQLKTVMEQNGRFRTAVAANFLAVVAGSDDFPSAAARWGAPAVLHLYGWYTQKGCLTI